MIITRSPLRITLGGGGTDLPSYYKAHEGFLIAAAIDRYIYIVLHKTFVEDILLKYSKLERVRSVRDIEHPIIREAFDFVGIDGRYLELTSMADIPAGTGLGTSGSFTTALLKALHTYRRNIVHPEELAEQACHIEIERLREPVGKQDQYIASYGGITCFRFNKNGKVDAWPLSLSDETQHNMEDGLLLFFTGYSREAGHILEEQDSRTKKNDKQMIDNLHYVKALALNSKDALESGDLRAFGELMHEHWEFKKKRSGHMSNPQIDEWYGLARRNGALGGKLVGAGGGGFLMFYTPEPAKLRHALLKAGLTEVRFKFEFEGTKVIVT